MRKEGIIWLLVRQRRVGTCRLWLCSLSLSHTQGCLVPLPIVSLAQSGAGYGMPSEAVAGVSSPAGRALQNEL